MADALDETQLDQALRDALRALPVPEASSDFDTRILAALQLPQPWWRRLWQPAKPLLLGASCSLSVMLFALHWTLTAPQPSIMGEKERPLAAAASPAPSLDALLDCPNLSAGSLAIWAERPPSKPSFDRRPEPRRKAQLLRCADLIV